MADRATCFFVGGVVHRGIRLPGDFGVSPFPNHISKGGNGCFPLIVLSVFTPSLPSPFPKIQTSKEHIVCYWK